ncbi:MAG TPA: methyltransferase domain-containing protein [Acetobacteraceae bacterium]|nr:methyltransferase domain-containing protein [Acetobacteraceae bacterium]
MSEPEWRRLNRASWDERVSIHLHTVHHYDQSALRAGIGQIDPIALAVLGPVSGQKILHLQCHFGMDSLVLAQHGATVVGIDFSAPAIAAARGLAMDLGLSDRARFIEADVYETPSALLEPASFDRVFVSWGALCWLPDMRAWARVVAHFLKPGGWLALAEAHPAAYVFDDAAGGIDHMPGWYAPYLARAPLLIDQPIDYADPDARLNNSRTTEWLHPLADVVTGLLEAGLRLEMLQEHDSVVWQMFGCLVGDDRTGYRWPDKPWLPLAYSLRASKPA